ncbi:MAG: NusG domain II-containing protein [Psychrilyobacter sp.]|uniref:NusG domain II-containing protein n=1 Tax=Psychrilyobacter sp. TaxID=2586924 RepID=UPI003C739058
MYFKRGDLIIYGIILGIFLILGVNIHKIKETKAERAEIYVNNQLKYTYKLQKAEKKFYVNTDIGGVGVKLKDNKIRVTSSYSPRKLCVKQGWIERSGQTIIGVPDKLLIKIVGEDEDDIDFILR